LVTLALLFWKKNLISKGGGTLRKQKKKIWEEQGSLWPQKKKAGEGEGVKKKKKAIIIKVT